MSIATTGAFETGHGGMTSYRLQGRVRKSRCCGLEPDTRGPKARLCSIRCITVTMNLRHAFKVPKPRIDGGLYSAGPRTFPSSYYLKKTQQCAGHARGWRNSIRQLSVSETGKPLAHCNSKPICTLQALLNKRCRSPAHGPTRNRTKHRHALKNDISIVWDGYVGPEIRTSRRRTSRRPNTMQCPGSTINLR